MLLERVDVVTGGASAVYGSDAVSGVVNYVVDRDFDGVKLVAQAGISGRNDDESTRFGVAFGADILGGRGHIEGSAEYYNSEGIDTKLRRSYGRRTYATAGAGTPSNPFTAIINARLSQSSNVGLIRSGPFADMVFAGPNNSLRAFVHGAPTGTIGLESGGDGIFFNATLQAELETKQAFGRDVTP